MNIDEDARSEDSRSTLSLDLSEYPEYPVFRLNGEECGDPCLEGEDLSENEDMPLEIPEEKPKKSILEDQSSEDWMLQNK